MTPHEKLIKANGDYHEAVDEILSDDELGEGMEQRAEIKAKFGAITDAVFNMMKQADELIAPYYEGS